MLNKQEIKNLIEQTKLVQDYINLDINLFTGFHNC